MPVEIQNNFSGGLNNRHPAYFLPEGYSPDLQNPDLSFRDLRPDKGTGIDNFDSAGSQYFYEAASAWVGASGFSTAQFVAVNLSNSNNQTISVNSTAADPVIVGIGSTLTVNSGVTMTVESQGDGFGVANSFVEYADDLYISRSGYNFTSTNIANVNNLAEITYASEDAGKFHIGDEIIATEIATGSLITAINKSTQKIILDQLALSTSSSSQTLSANSSPIRFMDGDITESQVIGVDIPRPTFSFALNSISTNGYSHNWISSAFPVPFQYGLSEIDATGIESGLSETSPSGSILELSQGTDFRKKAINIELGNLTTGKYFIYRIGDTSAVFKLLEYFYQKPTNVTFSFGARNSTTGAHLFTVTDSSAVMPANTQYALRWYAAAAASKASSVNSSTDLLPTGTTTFTSSLTQNIFTNNTSQKLFVEVLVKLSGDTREYVAGSCTIDGTSAVSTNAFSSYIDFKNAQTLALFSPFEQSNQPPKNLKFITEANNFFFASIEKRLYISRSGQPNVWPIDAFIDFDAKITGLAKRGSELVVFTQFALYRVFGNAFDSMRKVEIPTREGIPDELHRTISEVRGGLIYANLNGIHYYDGSSVQSITQNILETFSLPSSNFDKNVAGSYNDQYYLLADSGIGFKVDLRDGAFKITKTTLTANNLFYRGATNRLYTDTAIIGLGNDLAYVAQTRDFTGGQITSEKLLTAFFINADSFAGTLTPVVDGSEQSSEAVTFSSQNVNRKFYLSNPIPGEKFAVKINGTSGKVTEVGVEYQDPSQFNLSRFDSVSIKYTGTPTFSVKIDDVEKIASTTLPSFTGDVSERTYYFPAMTEGTVPHLIGVETETNKIVSYSFNSEAI
mgnify:CR=1 FL=1